MKLGLLSVHGHDMLLPPGSFEPVTLTAKLLESRLRSALGETHLGCVVPPELPVFHLQELFCFERGVTEVTARFCGCLALAAFPGHLLFVHPSPFWGGGRSGSLSVRAGRQLGRCAVVQSLRTLNRDPEAVGDGTAPRGGAEGTF